MGSLTDDERDYVITLVSGPGPKGRRPVKRIKAIDCKAALNIGSDLIVDGGIVPEHLEWTMTLNDRTHSHRRHP